MTATLLTAKPTETITLDQLRERADDASLPYEDTDTAILVTCADPATEGFWTERLTAWGAEVTSAEVKPDEPVDAA